jgi:hypothetical protein
MRLAAIRSGTSPCAPRLSGSCARRGACGLPMRPSLRLNSSRSFSELIGILELLDARNRRHRVVSEIGKSWLRRADGANAYTRWIDWHIDRCSPSRSIIMPPSIVIPAMPVKGIVDPTRVRTVWRSPKRVSPHGTDHAADDCTRRPGNDKSNCGSGKDAAPRLKPVPRTQSCFTT